MSGRVGVGGGVFGQTGLPLDGGTITGALTLQSTLAVTGAVTMSSTLAVTGAMTLESTLVQTKDAIGTGATAGYTLRNTTDAAAGAQQYSPMFVLTGEGWKTDATAATQVWDWAQQNRPVEGAVASTSALHWLSQVAGGGYTSRMNLSDTGGLIVSGTAKIGGTGALTMQHVSAVSYMDGTTALKLRVNEADMFAATTTTVQVGRSGLSIGMYGATPVVRAATIVDADGTLADITTKFNTLLVALENIGILLTA